jgi:hypothetical protein
MNFKPSREPNCFDHARNSIVIYFDIWDKKKFMAVFWNEYGIPKLILNGEVSVIVMYKKLFHIISLTCHINSIHNTILGRWSFKVWGPHISDYRDYCLLEYDTV